MLLSFLSLLLSCVTSVPQRLSVIRAISIGGAEMTLQHLRISSDSTVTAWQQTVDPSAPAPRRIRCAASVWSFDKSQPGMSVSAGQQTSSVTSTASSAEGVEAVVLDLPSRLRFMLPSPKNPSVYLYQSRYSCTCLPHFPFLSFLSRWIFSLLLPLWFFKKYCFYDCIRADVCMCVNSCRFWSLLVGTALS